MTTTRTLPERFDALMESSKFHIIVLIAGALFLLTDAFHGNIWFDESYSVGIANHTFAEIWNYSSGDVHPVLIYWALHVLKLVFGQNILVYRLFTVAGAVAMALLGFTHVRRDANARTGLLFSFFSLFTPYIAIMAVEIRMYSWATFSVMLCFIYALRLIGVLKERPHENIARQAAGRKCLAGAPVAWWIVCFVSSLACAYLHYFGAMSAFMINVVLLAFTVRRAFRHRRRGPRPLPQDAPGAGKPLAVLLVGCAAQVALYLPWIVTAVTSQMGVVGRTYWANIVFPTTFIELASYPVLTSQVSFALRGDYGSGVQLWLNVLGWVAAFVIAFLIVWGIRWGCWRASLHREARRAAVAQGKQAGRLPRAVRLRRFGAWLASEEVTPIVCALVVYGGVYFIALGASLAMNSLILYYRYLFVAIGPLLVAIAIIASHIQTRKLLVGLCAVWLAAGITNQALIIHDDYSADNDVPIDKFRDLVDEVAYDQGGQLPLVVSTDIGYMGVTSVMCPDIPQTYMDWQKGNWDRAYMAYSPTLTSKMSWEIIFDNFRGTFIVEGQSQDGSLPRDISDLSQKDGFTLVKCETYYRPYERTWLTLAVMKKA